MVAILPQRLPRIKRHKPRQCYPFDLKRSKRFTMQPLPGNVYQALHYIAKLVQEGEGQGIGICDNYSDPDSHQLANACALFTNFIKWCDRWKY